MCTQRLQSPGVRRFQPTIAARSSQIEFIVELVAADLGIAFLPPKSLIIQTFAVFCSESRRPSGNL
jgi:DNA-binding transcriptional LysR family regulator